MSKHYDLVRDYKVYIDYLITNGGSYIFTFEEYVNNLFSIGKIAEDELKS